MTLGEELSSWWSGHTMVVLGIFLSIKIRSQNQQVIDFSYLWTIILKKKTLHASQWLTTLTWAYIQGISKTTFLFTKFKI